MRLFWRFCFFARHGHVRVDVRAAPTPALFRKVRGTLSLTSLEFASIKFFFLRLVRPFAALAFVRNPAGGHAQGGILNFNLLRLNGSYFGYSDVSQLAASNNFHIRVRVPPHTDVRQARPPHMGQSMRARLTVLVGVYFEGRTHKEASTHIFEGQDDTSDRSKHKHGAHLHHTRNRAGEDLATTQTITTGSKATTQMESD